MGGLEGPPKPPFWRSGRPGGAGAPLNELTAAWRIVRATLSVGAATRYTGRVSDARRTLGRAAEDAAARFLERAGLAVTDRNVRFREGEIDLVCCDAGVVVFVEVKCRRASWGDAPAAAVAWHKQRRLTRLAQHYLKSRRLDGVRCRFDVVSVTLGACDVLQVRHLPAAFDAAGG